MRIGCETLRADDQPPNASHPSINRFPTPVPTPPLILASGSPYRRELLTRLRLPFDVVVSDVDESAHDGERPEATALRLARAKAVAVATSRPAAVVIGADQVAECDGQPFGKPGGHAAAVAQLRALSGRVVHFHSGLAVAAPEASGHGAGGAVRSDVVTTTVRFRTLSDDVIERYLRADRPYDCAGSAKAEGLGIVLLERIDSSDPTALIGLPLIALVTMLAAIGFPLPT